MKIIAVSFQKGGVGKTTTAFHLAFSGKKTLVIDLDAQRSLSYLFTDNVESALQSAFDWIHEGNSIRPIKITDKIDLLPSSYAGFHFDLETSKESISSMRANMANSLKGLEYELIVFDCSPMQMIPTMLAQSLSDYIIIPVQARTSSLQSIYDLLLFFKHYQIKGEKLILPTMVDSRVSAHKIVLEKLQNNFGKNCLFPIPESTKIEDIFTYKSPVLDDSKPGIAYKRLISVLEENLNEVL